MNIGFVSAAYRDDDTFTVEALKWADLLLKNGHKVFWFGGEFTEPIQKGFLCEEAHQESQENLELQELLMQGDDSDSTQARLQEAVDEIRISIDEFVLKYSIDLIVSQNSLTPFSLTLALCEYCDSTGIPMVVRHSSTNSGLETSHVAHFQELLNDRFSPEALGLHVTSSESESKSLQEHSGIEALVVSGSLEQSMGRIFSKLQLNP